MKPLDKAGFTIIETMLFLGISGLLMAGILIGTGTQISIQRYRDSVTSLRSTLQQQYSDVANVSNDNSVNLACNGAIMALGQSDCIILGRLITAKPGGSALNISDVIGIIPTTSTSALSDADALTQPDGYNVQFSPATSSTYELEWGASLAKTKPNSDEAKNFSILIVRSPTSGLIKTFIDPDNSITTNDNDRLKNLIKSSSALTDSVEMCVNSNGLLTSTRMAVQVNAYAISADSVVTLGDSSEC